MTTEVRQEELVVIPADHVDDSTSSIDEDADLAADPPGDLGHGLGELHGHHLVGRYSSSIHAIERVHLASL